MSYLPSDPKERKDAPVYSGVLAYFPDALVAVARLSKAGNDQHNPGQPLHWAREKSTDHADCIVRHQLDHGTLDSDGQRHSTKVAWRSLAQLQLEIEAEAKKPGTVYGKGTLTVDPVQLYQLNRQQAEARDLKDRWDRQITEAATNVYGCSPAMCVLPDIKILEGKRQDQRIREMHLPPGGYAHPQLSPVEIMEQVQERIRQAFLIPITQLIDPKRMIQSLAADILDKEVWLKGSRKVAAKRRKSRGSPARLEQARLQRSRLDRQLSRREEVWARARKVGASLRARRASRQRS